MTEKPQIDRLLVDGVFKSRHWLFEENPEKGQEVLKRVHQHQRPVVCTCHDATPIPMVVVCRQDRYHLRRLSNGGSQHHHNCVSYGGINERAQRLYEDEALRETADGVQVCLDAPLSELKNERLRTEAADVGEHATESRKRRTMSLLGLLNYLWEEAELNIWWPRMDGKRYPSLVRHLLMQAAQDRMVGKGIALADILFIPQAPRKGEETNNADALRAHLKSIAGLRGDGETCFAIVVGEVTKLIEPAGGKAASGIVLSNLFTAPLWDNHGLVKQLTRRFPNPMNRLKERVHAKEAFKRANAASPQPGTGMRQPIDLPNDYLLYGIFTVALSPSGSFVLRRGALMETSRRYIPIASDCEGRVEKKLYGERRAFEKPLVYDGERWSFPDFYLLDTGLSKPPVLEVYGYSGDEYEAKKRTKHVEYVREHVPYWYWDVKASPHQIPEFTAFPKASRTTATAPGRWSKPAA